MFDPVKRLYDPNAVEPEIRKEYVFESDGKKYTYKISTPKQWIRLDPAGQYMQTSRVYPEFKFLTSTFERDRHAADWSGVGALVMHYNPNNSTVEYRLFSVEEQS